MENQLNENQVKFLEAVKRYEELKNNLKFVSDELDGKMALLEIGSYFQDPGTLVVYHIVRPKGTFVPYKTVNYERTALECESKGSLSKKEATEAGFYLTKQE